ncbi:cytochrome P450 6B5-like [Leguminivora glycinivorella]|uniref:cytochrome P450 6B5-like n=1 Tax=Leguminivora glycinivorella TaxID=1035111 RepID=UPI00200C445B|nr:cytochrome P450 6B5-like [Leguminivora glycinivorella]
MVPIILTIFFVIGSFLYCHFTKYNNYWNERNIIGPKPTFFFGNLKDTMLRRKPFGHVLKDIYDMYPKEKVVGIFVMRSPELLIRDLDVIKNILIKDFDTFPNRGFEFKTTGFGANLFHGNGETWRLLRSRFSPLFTPGKLKNMMHLLSECGDKFVDYVARITKSNPEQEAHTMTQKYTLAAIAACAFGIDIDTFNYEYEKLRRIDRKIFTIHITRELEMMYPGILKKYGGSLFPKEVITFFIDLVKDVTEKRNGKPTDRNDFMDLILKMRGDNVISGPIKKNNDIETSLELTDEVIAAQAFSFYAGGYETSASTMGFLLYELALNPQIQDKVVAEIKDVVKKHNGELTLQAVSDLSYMGQVFDETLRKYPIVSDLRRKANSAYTIPGTDIAIEKNLLIKISVLGIHYDKKIYPNPEKFDPERFSPEVAAARHSCAYLPFGLGPRNCIGYRFAQLQSRVCLAKLLSHFRVEPSKNTPRQFQYDPRRIVLYPIGGVKLNFVKRH